MNRAASASLSPDGAVSVQVHLLLRDQMIRGSLPPGQRLSETEVAATYNISRQPVREAFIKLAEEGLVEIRPQRGTFVRRISVAAAQTTRLIREAVEADLVQLAIKRAPDGLVADLDAQIAQQAEVAKTGAPEEFVLLDEAFHRTFAKAAGTPDVSQYLEKLNIQMNRVRNISAREFAPDLLVSQHAAIVDAIRRGDAAQADSALRTHLRKFSRDLPQIVETYPTYFEDIEALEHT